MPEKQLFSRFRPITIVRTDTNRIWLVGILGLGIGFAAGVFLGPRPPSNENVLRVRVMQAERDNDLLREKNALLEQQLAELNAVLARDDKPD